MEGDVYVVLLALLEGEINQDEYLYLNDIELRYVRLPRYVYGFIYKYKDVFLIAINKSLSETKKKKTILHELAHFELSSRSMDYSMQPSQIRTCGFSAYGFSYLGLIILVCGFIMFHP